MAKAAEIEVSPDEPYARAAARIVRVRAHELFGHAEGVLDTEDIERVHDMRVASRRLRAVLEVFAPCFPKGPYKSVLRDVKRLADALGERRDPDVHLAAMEKLAATLPDSLRPGVELLADRPRAFFLGLTGYAQIVDGRHLPPLAVDQLFLVLLEQRDVAADGDGAAVARGQLVHLQPAPVGEMPFEGDCAAHAAREPPLGQERLHPRLDLDP